MCGSMDIGMPRAVVTGGIRDIGPARPTMVQPGSTLAMKAASFTAATGMVHGAALNMTTAGTAIAIAIMTGTGIMTGIGIIETDTNGRRYSSSVTHPLLALFTSRMYLARVPRVAL
jgi:hypothetical protein